jgi:hypothetical protein
MAVIDHQKDHHVTRGLNLNDHQPLPHMTAPGKMRFVMTILRD